MYFTPECCKAFQYTDRESDATMQKECFAPICAQERYRHEPLSLTESAKKLLPRRL